MKKSRSASKRRPAKKKPAKSRAVAAKRRGPKKTKKTVKARSTAAKRRTSPKTRTRAAAKKTRAGKPATKTARSAARPRKASVAKKTKTRAAATRVTRAAKPVVAAVPANELKVGVVTHYYSHLSVAVVAVTDRPLHVGDPIHIKGHTSDFRQTVDSIQIEHGAITAAGIGQTVGLRVTAHAREHDVIYLVT